MWFDYAIYGYDYIKVAQLRPPVTKMVTGLSIGYRVLEFCLFIILPIENCIQMNRNALSIEAVGRRTNL